MSDTNMMSKVIGKVIGDIGDKKRWWAYRARVKELPENYRAAVEAMQRYLMFFGGADGAGWASMHEDLLDLFEQSAANGTPIREIFGNDPVEFAEAFAQNYPEGQWRKRQQDRFRNAIGRVAEEGTTGR